MKFMEMPMYAELYSYIPMGEKYAISRRELVRKMHIGDRLVRSMIADLRGEAVILSSPKGGYYIPGTSELEKVKEYVRKEDKRAKSVFAAVKYAKAYCEDAERGRFRDGTS